MSKLVDTDKRPLNSGSGFVNRRGHSATQISNAELSQLSIDDQPERSDDMAEAPHNLSEKDRTHSKATKDFPHNKPPTREKVIRVRRRTVWSRKKTVLLITIIAAIVAIPIVLGEALRAQYVASTDAAARSVRSIVEKDVLPLQKKTDITSKQVATIVTKVEAVRDDMCPGALLDNVAMLYPRARDAHSACISKRSELSALVTDQRVMVNMLAYLESVNTALAQATAPSTDTFAVIANQQSSWQTVNERMKDVKPPSTFVTGHAGLIAAIAIVSEGWSKLNIANNEQNADDFNTAEQQLARGYNQIRESRAQFASAISAQQAKITRTAVMLQ